MIKIAVVMTCHSRRTQTLVCLDAVRRSQFCKEVTIEVFLVDDGSTDGTSEAVRSRFPEVHLIVGNGSLYWAGGMRKAMGFAMEQKFDYYCWLNDDTLMIDSGALDRLVAWAEDLRRHHGRPAIVVGTIVDPVSGETSYGGVRFPSIWHRTRAVVVSPKSEPVACESMNGNCVLFPAEVVAKIGNLDPAFTHGLADFDYGFRARKAGFMIYAVAPPAGTCSRNTIQGSFLDASLSLPERWKLVCGPKGRPMRPWAVYTHRHLGTVWFLFWIFPYLRVVVSSVYYSFRRAVGIR